MRDPLIAVAQSMSPIEWGVVIVSVTVAAVLILGTLGRLPHRRPAPQRIQGVQYPPPPPAPTQRDIDQTWLLAWADADDDIDARFNEIVAELR